LTVGGMRSERDKDATEKSYRRRREETKKGGKEKRSRGKITTVRQEKLQRGSKESETETNPPALFRQIGP